MLPLDIQYLIWDRLDCSDAVAVHQAFTGASEWRLPVSYRQQRAPGTLTFEIQTLIDQMNSRKSSSFSSDVEVEVDWEALSRRRRAAADGVVVAGGLTESMADHADSGPDQEGFPLVNGPEDSW